MMCGDRIFFKMHGRNALLLITCLAISSAAVMCCVADAADAYDEIFASPDGSPVMVPAETDLSVEAGGYATVKFSIDDGVYSKYKSSGAYHLSSYNVWIIYNPEFVEPVMSLSEYDRTAAGDNYVFRFADMSTEQGGQTMLNNIASLYVTSVIQPMSIKEKDEGGVLSGYSSYRATGVSMGFLLSQTYPSGDVFELSFKTRGFRGETQIKVATSDVDFTDDAAPLPNTLCYAMGRFEDGDEKVPLLYRDGPPINRVPFSAVNVSITSGVEPVANIGKTEIRTVTNPNEGLGGGDTTTTFVSLVYPSVRVDSAHVVMNYDPGRMTIKADDVKPGKLSVPEGGKKETGTVEAHVSDGLITVDWTYAQPYGQGVCPMFTVSLHLRDGQTGGEVYAPTIMYSQVKLTGHDGDVRGAVKWLPTSDSSNVIKTIAGGIAPPSAPSGRFDLADLLDPAKPAFWAIVAGAVMMVAVIAFFAWRSWIREYGYDYEYEYEG